MLTFHTSWAWIVIFANGFAGLWALAAIWLKGLRTRALWWYIAFAELAIVVQVLVGVAMISIEERNVNEFHMFYGFIALITVGLIYSYRQRLKRHAYLLYGLGSLFLMGLGIRAMLKGQA